MLTVYFSEKLLIDNAIYHVAISYIKLEKFLSTLCVRYYTEC